MEIYKVFQRILTAFILFLLVCGSAKRRGKEYKNTNYPDGTCSCGIATDDRGELVINGADVTPPNKYPWMVKIVKPNLCGGALLSSNAIVTAAHCIKKSGLKKCSKAGKLPKQCWIKAKDISIGFVTDSSNISIYNNIVDVIPNPTYGPNGISGDIGILIMKDPIKCTQSTRPICLPTKRMSEVGTPAVIAGWGTVDTSTGTVSDTLKEANLMVLPRKNCNHIRGFKAAKKSVLCLIGADQAPCFGDSGASIVYKEDSTYYTLGITSLTSSATCNTTEPTVFTDVNYFLPFIRKTLKKFKRKYNH